MTTFFYIIVECILLYSIPFQLVCWSDADSQHMSTQGARYLCLQFGAGVSLQHFTPNFFLPLQWKELGFEFAQILSMKMQQNALSHWFPPFTLPRWACRQYLHCRMALTFSAKSIKSLVKYFWESLDWTTKNTF